MIWCRILVLEGEAFLLLETDEMCFGWYCGELCDVLCSAM